MVVMVVMVVVSMSSSGVGDTDFETSRFEIVPETLLRPTLAIEDTEESSSSSKPGSGSVVKIGSSEFPFHDSVVKKSPEAFWS
jgi:hypothetical protein